MEKKMEKKTTDKKSANKYQKSIDLLNKALGEEIATSLQYMYFHVSFANAGYQYLAKRLKKISIDEMIHCEELSERILFLEGRPNMNQGFKALQVDDPIEALRLAIKLEEATIDEYNHSSHVTAEIEDVVTHKMFQDLTVQEEGHVDYFRTELQHLLDYGEKEYLALQAVAWSESEAKGGSTD